MQTDEITFKIIGCAIKLDNTLGNGFQKVIYQRCLAFELRKAAWILLGKRANYFL